MNLATLKCDPELWKMITAYCHAKGEKLQHFTDEALRLHIERKSLQK